MADHYQSWRDALAGKKLDMGTKGSPPCGYFRRNAGPKGWEAISVWRDEGGALCCERNIFGTGENMSAEEIDDLFAGEVYAIPHDVYLAVFDGHPWPVEYTARLTLAEVKAGVGMTAELGRAKKGADALMANDRAVIGDNSQNAAPHELLAGRINDLGDARSAWLKEIGTITTQEQADKAAGFAEAFAKLEKEAVDAHKVEKEPWLKGGREVDARWKPIAAAADDGKRASKAALTPYLKRKDEEAREAARRAAAEAAERQQPAPVEAVKPRAVNGGRGVSLRTVRAARVTDLPKVAAFFAGMASPDRDFADLCRRLADKALKAGVEVPGAEIIETQEAA